MYQELGEQCGRTLEELHAVREPRFRQLVEERLRPTPELLELLHGLREAGVKRGIASSSDSDWVAYLVDGLGLRHEFQAIATGHDVAQRKPAPDVYLLAAARLAVDPTRCVALEDSSHGIEAARAAGMRAIAIPNSVSIHQDLSLAHTRVQHFGEVTLDLLRRIIA
jgi:putative hydrolase of the HAD superfamily